MLMAPDNGMIDCSLGDDGVPTNGDTCTVTCNDGFRLRGDARRKCQAGQMRWLGDEARCVPGVDKMYYSQYHHYGNLCQICEKWSYAHQINFTKFSNP